MKSVLAIKSSKRIIARVLVLLHERGFVSTLTQRFGKRQTVSLVIEKHYSCTKDPTAENFLKKRRGKYRTNRPYLYSRYRTGTSLQLTPVRGVFKCK